MHATIKDIARESGVSITAVSLVLNKKDCRISEATKEKIFKTAKALNYRPNNFAVSLVTKKTHNIGLIVPDLNNLHFSALCTEIEHVCKENGYIVLFGSCGSSPKQALDYFNIFIDKGVEGIIFARPFDLVLSEEEKECFNLADQADIPVVIFENAVSGKRIAAVEFDYKLGGYQATNYLLKCGHKKIGCITGPSCTKSSVARLEGYKKALAEASLPFDRNLVFEGDFKIESGTSALPYMLGQQVTGIFAFNDMMAFGVYKAARNYNLKIPKDFSLIGFDDSFLNEILEVPLTSVVHPSQDVGKEAAKQIIRLINRQNNSDKIVIEPILNVRASCGAPPSSIENI